MPLETDRLILREIQLTDFDAIHEYASDPETVEFVDWGPNTIEDTQQFLDIQIANQSREDRNHYVFAVTLKDSGELIGTCGMIIEEDHGEFGYALNKKYWGKGYATEATKRLLQFAEETCGIARFKAICDVLNGASRRVLEKCGLKLVKRIDHDVKIRGRWKDTYVFENVSRSLAVG